MFFKAAKCPHWVAIRKIPKYTDVARALITLEI